MTNKELSFGALYAEIRSRHPDLVEISRAAVTQIENELDQTRRLRNTPSYIASASSGVVMLVSYPLCFVRALDFVREELPEFMRMLASVSIAGHPGRQISLVLFMFSVLMYTVVLPGRRAFFGKLLLAARAMDENVELPACVVAVNRRDNLLDLERSQSRT